MSDDITVSRPVEIKEKSVERVAFDLMEKISMAEKTYSQDSEKKTNPREYYLKLYNQCLKVTSGSRVDVKDIL